ncbi:hypothetical protein GYMLUDRAFT_247598 [Collybiopsis luxurians FD-317 M1]|uniref:Unplaced genomic scaffold GYMLUscaffold_47, whole genome shotgun sequence n=1 Tax=Collybiopsis luxurians FD-317 M1 TaxID=944289 RepID=A0A0D0CFE5_9AGAR|nr:hypothetical protein GYMLUDRAFT_247598 [Collybiopsis luxurians FD-317 M1]
MSNYPPILEAPFAQVNDMDSNDLPSSAATTIDTDNDNDSASITSSPAKLVKDCKDEINEKVLMEVMKELLGGVEVDEVFNFLPSPNLDDIAEGEVTGFDPFTAAHCNTLVDDDVQNWTWQWYNSAGAVLQSEPLIQSHWTSLLAKDGSVESGYHPFKSCLD